jgi:hypothetical protein
MLFTVFSVLSDCIKNTILDLRTYAEAQSKPVPCFFQHRSTAAFGNEADITRFYDYRQLKRFLDFEGFSNEAALYIIEQLGMESTKHLALLLEEDIENHLQNLTPDDKKHLFDIITWAHEHKGMIDDNDHEHEDMINDNNHEHEGMIDDNAHEHYANLQKVHGWLHNIHAHQNTQ